MRKFLTRYFITNVATSKGDGGCIVYKKSYTHIYKTTSDLDNVDVEHYKFGWYKVLLI